MTISSSILEKLFSMMDTNEIGMVDYEKFSDILNIETMNQLHNTQVTSDGFDWQEEIIYQIKKWILDQKLSPLEAFRSFDKSMNGYIGKVSMKESLIEFLGIIPAEITDSKLDRLFKLMSFFKTDLIQQSDFDRLLRDQNPYKTASTGQTANSFNKSLGGGFEITSTNNWKFAAIQQIGLRISKNYESIQESFDDATGETNIINFAKFQKFVHKNEALQGFDITYQLLQKIFAELDPHKKTFLNYSDW